MLNLREIRERKGISAREVAEYLDCSKDHVYDMERGESSPKISELQKMAQLFGVSLSYIIFDKNYDVKVSELEQNCSEKDDEINCKNKIIEAWNTKCSELEKKLREANEKNKELTSQCEFLKNTGHDIIEKRDAEYDALEKKYNELSESFNKLTALNEDLQKSYDELKEANAEYEAEIDMLNERSERYYEKWNAAVDRGSVLYEKLQTAYCKLSELVIKYKII